MKIDFLQQLLCEDEGPTLDFKRDQYAFSKASEEEKSELLKDIIGFVNGWRRGEAFILIGVIEVQGGKSTVHGISEHLADHSLQQFVNNLTNRPVRFAYEACECEGKQVGVIRIEVQQRPVFLKRDYGKLKKGQVYVRRGSSTDPSKPADPDEIALMGSGNRFEEKQASVCVEFADPRIEQSLGSQLEWTAENCEMPKSKQIPNLVHHQPEIRFPGGDSIRMPDLSALDPMNQLNREFFREFANYEFFRRLVREVRLVIANTGNAPATDVRLEIEAPCGHGYAIFRRSDIPSKPKQNSNFLEVAGRMNDLQLRHHGSVSIDENEERIKVEIDCGNLQPGRKVWTDSFYIGVGQTDDIEISGSVFAENLATPQVFTLRIKAEIEHTSMSVEELVALGKAADGK